LSAEKWHVAEKLVPSELKNVTDSSLFLKVQHNFRFQELNDSLKVHQLSLPRPRDAPEFFCSHLNIIILQLLDGFAQVVVFDANWEVRTMDNEIKNLKGNVIGHIKTEDELVYAFDNDENMVGSYNPKTNTTYAKDGKPIGYGNQLSALLYK